MTLPAFVLLCFFVGGGTVGIVGGLITGATDIWVLPALMVLGVALAWIVDQAIKGRE
ncbi:hypothetical protein [Luteimicrobium sp. DT211]|uniref:hypothetical protein n=1 Tax=Luteimicrobium sp. DT211 TaxID=3393412 RepID=UPI003CF0FDA9